MDKSYADLGIPVCVQVIMVCVRSPDSTFYLPWAFGQLLMSVIITLLYLLFLNLSIVDVLNLDKHCRFEKIPYNHSNKKHINIH